MRSRRRGPERRVFWAALLGSLLFTGIAGCGPDWPPTAEGLYMSQCARCHEPDGSSRTASEMAGKRVDLRDPVFQELCTDEEIARIVVHGQGKMTGIFGITDAQVDSVVQYVRRLGRAASELDTLRSGS